MQCSLKVLNTLSNTSTTLQSLFSDTKYPNMKWLLKTICSQNRGCVLHCVCLCVLALSGTGPVLFSFSLTCWAAVDLGVVDNKNRISGIRPPPDCQTLTHTHRNTHTLLTQECDVTIGNAMKSTNNTVGSHHPVWMFGLHQGTGHFVKDVQCLMKMKISVCLADFLKIFSPEQMWDWSTVELT